MHYLSLILFSLVLHIRWYKFWETSCRPLSPFDLQVQITGQLLYLSFAIKNTVHRSRFCCVHFRKTQFVVFLPIRLVPVIHFSLLTVVDFLYSWPNWCTFLKYCICPQCPFNFRTTRFYWHLHTFLMEAELPKCDASTTWFVNSSSITSLSPSNIKHYCSINSLEKQKNFFGEPTLIEYFHKKH